MIKNAAERDCTILIYSKEDVSKYNTAIKVLEETKWESGWDIVRGLIFCNDYRIPQAYHGSMAIVMERYNGTGKYSVKVM